MNTAVYRRNIAPNAGNSPRSQFIHHIVPKLSPNTGHKYFHMLTYFHTFSRNSSDTRRK